MAASPVTVETLDTPFLIGGREFRSRLMVGTGKYASNAQMIAAIEASGAEGVTGAVRRVDLGVAVEHHPQQGRAASAGTDDERHGRRWLRLR